MTKKKIVYIYCGTVKIIPCLSFQCKFCNNNKDDFFLQNGQLHSGDHILQIGDVNVRGMSSEQVAAVLRQSGREVRLIVARPVNEPSAYPTPHAPVVPTHQLDEHLQQINALLHGEHINQHMADELAAGMIQVHMVMSEIHFREEI